LCCCAHGRNVAARYGERKELIQNLSIAGNFGEKYDGNYAKLFIKSGREEGKLERERAKNMPGSRYRLPRAHQKKVRRNRALTSSF
jgi:hypothetical protein